MRKFLRWASVAAIGLALFIFLNNTNLITPDDDGKPMLLAHRGIAQRYSPEGIDNDTCTATRILPPENDYLENTIAAMKAAYDAGADMVEFDVHPTRDGQFAVFHDWTLDCRTNGTGVTREHSMAELKALDIGYGYTADGGKTYPFRGKGVGLMPTLAEVLEAFADRQLMINVKSNDPKEGELLADVLAKLSPERRKAFIVYGGDRPVTTLKQRLPDITVFSKESLRDCLYPYIAYGWTGLLPGACHDTALLVPIDVAPWLWGWPNRFLDRMEDVDTRVFALGPLRTGDGTAGIDSLEELDQLPKDYSGGIWTNEIGLIANKLRVAGRL